MTPPTTTNHYFIRIRRNGFGDTQITEVLDLGSIGRQMAVEKLERTYLRLNEVATLLHADLDAETVTEIATYLNTVGNNAQTLSVRMLIAAEPPAAQ